MRIVKIKSLYTCECKRITCETEGENKNYKGIINILNWCEKGIAHYIS